MKSLGADVTAVCDTDNVELVRGLGADRVIDYTAEDFTKDQQTYDVVLDSVGKSSFSQCKRLDLELDEHLGVTQLDMRKTKQIVYNLLSNAVKFSSQGGLVSLHARQVPRSCVGTLEGAWPVRRFALADNEFTEFLEIRVTDGGIGISEANMAKLFQAFTQIDSSLARRFEGTGLGLAMVKQMTELLGGSVAVASKEDEGTCFAAWVPLRRAVQCGRGQQRGRGDVLCGLGPTSTGRPAGIHRTPSGQSRDGRRP